MCYTLGMEDGTFIVLQNRIVPEIFIHPDTLKQFSL